MKFSQLLILSLIAASAAGTSAQTLTGPQAAEPIRITQFAGSIRPGAVTAAAVTDVSAPEADAEREAFDLVNARRAANGLKALEWRDDLAEIARAHSRDMARQNFFSHKSLDGSMVDDRAERSGVVEWANIGENIAFVQGYKGPVEFTVERWMDSPGHRRNILDNLWTESGMGVAITPDGKYYFTQVFLLRK